MATRRFVVIAIAVFWLLFAALWYAKTYYDAAGKVPFLYLMVDVWHTHTIVVILAIAVALFWFLGGIATYVIMYYCDTATGKPLCRGKFFVMEHPLFSFCMAVFLPPLAVFAAYQALQRWRAHTMELQLGVPEKHFR